jgi:hypothetical protein|tara:strand:+ start:10961 stop:12457 length:1497 start_codon:yes stop_codon:yes gene_type:complete
MNINKWRIYKAIWLTILLSVVLCVFSCTKKEKRKKPIEKIGLSQLTKKILFNPWEIQDYQCALNHFHSVGNDTLSGEENILHGLAHIYQGEVYDVVANMLAEMQLDLFYKSTDLDHRMKFPIINNNNTDDIQDELTFWMGIDAYTVYGRREGDKLLASTPSNPFYKLKQNIIKSFNSNRNTYKDHTFLEFGIKTDETIKHIPTFKKIIEAEALFEKEEYNKVLTYFDNEKLYSNNIFKNHQYVSYYSPAVFKLAALSHYKLGIKVMEDGIHSRFTTNDSTGYKMIAIMNIGQKYYYFEDDEKLSLLWKDNEQFVIQQSSLLKNIVETSRMPYCLDWVLFENAVISVITNPFPKKLMFLNDKTNIPLKIMKSFLVDNSSVTVNEVHHVLMDFYKNPERMDEYPTLMSGFIEVLNQSDFAITQKKLIQDVTESMVFTVEHSKASWQRNRPAFLLSLYGSLRWHGGRLPDLNGFLIELRKLDNRLGSLQEVSSLFTQSLIK